MFVSTTIAIVIDNHDPEKRHRVKVKFVTDSVQGMYSESSWCRMLTPMGGPRRGLVMLPEVGTEVIVGFAYRSMSPYILGAAYNGKDLPEPYRNDDCLNNVRVFWSRNDHMVVFDDTEGMEKVAFGAQAPIRLRPSSAGIHSILDSSAKTITSKCDGDSIIEADQTVSILCRNFKLEASNTIDIESGEKTVLTSGSSTTIEAQNEATYNAGTVQLNPSSKVVRATDAKPVPVHAHPPAKPNLLGTLGGGASMATAAAGEDQGEAGEVAEGTAESEGAEGTDAWDDLRGEAPDKIGGAVEDAVGGIAGDVLGDDLGRAIGEAAGDLAERAVDDALGRAEEAVRGALGGDGAGSGRPTDGAGRPTSGRPTDGAGRPTSGRPTDGAGRPTSGRPTDAAGRPTGERPTDGAGRPTDEAGRPTGERPTDEDGRPDAATSGSGSGRPTGETTPDGRPSSDTTDDGRPEGSSTSSAPPTADSSDDGRPIGSSDESMGGDSSDDMSADTDRPASDSSSSSGRPEPEASADDERPDAGGASDESSSEADESTGAGEDPPASSSDGGDGAGIGSGVRLKRRIHPHPETMEPDMKVKSGPLPSETGAPAAAKPKRPSTKPEFKREKSESAPSASRRRPSKKSTRRTTSIDVPDLPDDES